MSCSCRQFSKPRNSSFLRRGVGRELRLANESISGRSDLFRGLRSSNRWRNGCLLVLGWLAVAGSCWGQPTTVQRSGVGQIPKGQDLIEWLPPSVVAVVRFDDLSNLWEVVEHLGLVQTAVGSDQFAQFQATPQYRQFLGGQRLVEGLFGASLADLYRGAATGPGVAAVDLEGRLALILTPSAETFAKISDVLRESAQLAGFSGDGGAAVRAVSYRGVSAYALNQVRIALHGQQVVIVSDSQLGKAILDRALGDRVPRCSETAWQRAARQGWAAISRPADHLQGTIDLDALRNAGKWKLQRGREVGQELLVGGLNAALDRAPLAIFTAAVTDRAGTVRISIPTPAELPAQWDYFFGKDAGAAGVPAPVPLNLPTQLAAVRWHRDLGSFWNNLPQLIQDENAQAALAKSESDIATLLGGVTTVGDLFGYLEPQLQLVIGPSAASLAGNPTALKLPTFALVGKLRKRAEGERVLRLAFQQLVSFANLNAGPGGYPPLEVLTERVEGTTMCCAEYMLMPSSNGREYSANALYENFAPTLAISDERIVLASHRAWAEEVLRATPQSAAESGEGDVTNTVLQVWPQEVVTLAEQNRDALLAQRMLQTGRPRDEVARELDLLFQLARQVQGASIRLAIDPHYVTLSAGLQWATPAASED